MFRKARHFIRPLTARISFETRRRPSSGPQCQHSNVLIFTKKARGPIAENPSTGIFLTIATAFSKPGNGNWDLVVLPSQRLDFSTSSHRRRSGSRPSGSHADYRAPGRACIKSACCAAFQAVSTHQQPSLHGLTRFDGINCATCMAGSQDAERLGRGCAGLKARRSIQQARTQRA